jgi:hypothetical protein
MTNLEGVKLDGERYAVYDNSSSACAMCNCDSHVTQYKHVLEQLQALTMYLLILSRLGFVVFM